MTSALNAHNPANHDRITRERWLELAIETYWRARFDQVGYQLPARFHVSVGFGHGAKRESATIEAQCWTRNASADHVNHIFVCPTVGDTVHVLALLGHELTHATLDSDAGIQDGHVKRFAEIMTRLGFDGPMTSTCPSEALKDELFMVSAALGEYPHGALDVTTARVRALIPVPGGGGGGGPKIRTGPPQQVNRHAKLRCTTEDCACGGYAVRTTQKWITVGLPSCPMGNEMQVID